MHESAVYELILLALAVWRVTHLLTIEDGPWQMFARMRQQLQRWSPEGADCFYCVSVWMAIPAALWSGRNAGERVVLWLALSGAAILLERATGGFAPARYIEHPAPGKGDEHDVLRKGQ